MFQTILYVVASIAGAALLLSMLRNPILRRMSFRHAVRWPGTTALVVFGTMIGTAMITGSLVVGDNVRDWVYRDVEARFGEIDQVVVLPDPRGIVDDRVRQSPDLAFFPLEFASPITSEQINSNLEAAGSRAVVNGALPAIQRPVPARGLDGSTGEVKAVAAEIMVLAVGWDQLSRFGENPPEIGQPVLGTAVISEKLAGTLNLVVGDSVQLIAGQLTADFPVAAIVPARGITGYGGMGWEDLQGTVMVNLPDAQELFAGGEPVVNSILVSHAGAVTESHARSSDVQAALQPLLQELDVVGAFEIVPVKQYAIEGATWVPIMFLIFSSFVILAGIALTVNIYASLAEERRGSMGIIRALGMRREHLVRLYLYEGLIYSLLAAAVGVLVGWGLARLMFVGINQLLDFVEFDRFVLHPSSLLTAAVVGMSISMATVLFTSLRTSYINVVAAMRGLAEPGRVHRSRWSLIWPALVIMAGVGLTLLALATDNVFAWILGPAILLVGIGFQLWSIGSFFRLQTLQRRAVLTVAFSAAMTYAWLTNEFSAAVQREHEATPLAFILIALVLIFGGIGVIALNLSSLLRPLQWLSTRARRFVPMMRMALAYPGSKPTRTSFTILMFTVVLFVVTLMHVMIGLFSASMEDMSEFEFGGFDILVFPNPANPIPDLEERIRASDMPELARLEHVTGFHFASFHLPEYRQADYADRGGHNALADETPLREQVIGVDEVFLRQTTTILIERAPEYGTDRDVWLAMEENSDLIVVDDRYRADSASRNRPPLRPGDTLTMYNPESGETAEKQVAGIMQAQIFWQTPMRGILMNAQAIQDDPGAGGIGAPVMYLVSIGSGIDDRAVGAAIEREFVESGVQATSVGGMIDEEQQWLSFMRIIQGFLGFGLFVGVAGLAVVATRAVHQRRRDIGTLRAIGFRRGMILGYFLAEASVVAIIGILLGTGIGSLSSVILFRYVLPEGNNIEFTYPTTEVVLTSLGIFVVALVFTVLPAIRASRLSVVEALRPIE
jgi:putative ABC transport system permease protein